jgi:RNA polymerase sigma factor FliA
MRTDEMLIETAEAANPSPAGANPSPHVKAVALRTYKKQTPAKLTDEEITQYLPMVNSIAHKVTSYLRPPLSFEDLVSAGTIGLVKAARDYDTSHGAQFKTYAYIRIKGAIIDELRNASMLPSNLNRQVKDVMELSHRITLERGSPATDEELAHGLGITREELSNLQDTARAQHFVSLDTVEPDGASLLGMLAAPQSAGPQVKMEQSELIDELTRAIGELDPKRRRIVVLYYQQHLTMKQIADVLSITESRVSQLHASALFNLSAKLREWKDGQQ